VPEPPQSGAAGGTSTPSDHIHSGIGASLDGTRFAASFSAER
jgi:hypothetical protein